MPSPDIPDLGQAPDGDATLPELSVAEQEQLAQREIDKATIGRIRGLRVQVVDGAIEITGRTSTYYNKLLATHAALKVRQGVRNEIEVS